MKLVAIVACVAFALAWFFVGLWIGGRDARSPEKGSISATSQSNEANAPLEERITKAFPLTQVGPEANALWQNCLRGIERLDARCRKTREAYDEMRRMGGYASWTKKEFADFDSLVTESLGRVQRGVDMADDETGRLGDKMVNMLMTDDDGSGQEGREK
jgi:hypothetical protein